VQFKIGKFHKLPLLVPSSALLARIDDSVAALEATMHIARRCRRAVLRGAVVALLRRLGMIPVTATGNGTYAEQLVVHDPGRPEFHTVIATLAVAHVVCLPAIRRGRHRLVHLPTPYAGCAVAAPWSQISPAAVWTVPSPQ